jgi:hypothetical protein
MRSLYEGESQRDEALKFDLFYPIHFQGLMYSVMGDIKRASETQIRAYNLIKHTSNDQNELLCLIKAIEMYCNGKMYDKAKETMKLAVDNFIGAKEDIKYTILKELSHFKGSSQMLESYCKNL